MRNLVALLLCLVSSTLFGQVLDVETKLPPTKYDLGQPICLTLSLPATDGTVNTDWEVSGVGRNSARLVDNQLFLWAVPGRYAVRADTVVATIVDNRVVLTRQKHLAELEIVGSIPPKPEPDKPIPPKPDPDKPVIPTDEFDNIGQRAANWSQGLPMKKEMGAVYETMGKGLKAGTFLTVQDTNAYFKARYAEVLSTDELRNAWVSWGKNLTEDFNKRKDSFNRVTLANYYEALAKGLK